MSRRPYYLNLLQIRLPIGGWVSILHRASGALLAVLVPLGLYGLMLSLRSEADFLSVRGFLAEWPGHGLLLVVLWASLHHGFAGLRHLGFDLGWGETRQRARQTAWASLLLAVALTVLLGGLA